MQFIRQIFVLVFLWYGKCAFIKKFTPNNKLKDTRNQRKLWESFMRRTAVTSGAHVNSAAWFTCSCQCLQFSGFLAPVCKHEAPHAQHVDVSRERGHQGIPTAHQGNREHLDRS